MKKAVLVASFGTTHEDTRSKTIDAVTNDIAAIMDGYEVRTAFTSSIIRKILEKREQSVDNVQQALTKLRDEGYEEVLIQPLHVISGEEFHNVIRDTTSFRADFKKIEIGGALLSSVDDYKAVVRAFDEEIKTVDADTAVIFMGHGTSHPANSAYPCLQSVFMAEGYDRVYIATVEGYPEFNDILEVLKGKDYKKVKLIPLMLVAGDHAKNDMAGEEEDSWKSILESEGFEVDVLLRGMGEMKDIRDIYVEHIRSLVR
ncbi:MAG TPA: sirohydrochlorin cobaltochelatase [Thermotogota bacterium]|nr:sirohydrochlorin cobaltochelatase [Thermotogota bacterium]